MLDEEWVVFSYYGERGVANTFPTREEAYRFLKEADPDAYTVEHYTYDTEGNHWIEDVT